VATFVLIHGAGDVGWYWHLVAAELRRRGHDVVAPDLPCDDDSAGLSEYADTVLDAIGDRRELVVVAQSFGAFTAPLLCTRVPVELLVLVAGLVPSPGEAPRDVLPRRPVGVGGRGTETRAKTVRHADAGAVAARRLAGRADEVPALPR
jgi:pimeloyl-ACP methyl ester carboxylesterase